ncbi:dipeptidase [Acuticoccus sp. M5D2P5]|uniref:dipeptidase n=1 Tax=Acuticoccus kalidii TaxID=2910977 RepID=UPI001F43AE5B|nr:dipeptidase [Acuticoccus kalidii]MCF3932831.1 dipeptidase [Acuticoccus kalidii]
MADPTSPPIFDGHNDILSKLAATGPAGAVNRFRSNPSAAIDAARAKVGGFAGGFFAVWVPSSNIGGPDYGAMSSPRFSVPLPPEVPHDEGVAAAAMQISILTELERAGEVRICRTAAALEETIGANGPLAAILHIEGAEAIDRDLFLLDVFHAAGLRSLGPVWSRPNRFGHGVPFRFPSSPDTGPGLTADGIRLVERCNALGIMVDLSHITEQGFWDIAKRSDKPLVATHSNAHALCATARNLTDRQLAAIAETGGMVGVNFATAFLREDGRMLPNVPVERVLDHIDHLLAHLGEDGVGLGSDYDGALVPEALTGIETLPLLREAMRARYGETVCEKLCWRNWVRVLKATWGA